MANRIKGITIEIGGDTTGLDKSLKTVNMTVRNTQSALKDVGRLLKIDPQRLKNGLISLKCFLFMKSYLRFYSFWEVIYKQM